MRFRPFPGMDAACSRHELLMLLAASALLPTVASAQSVAPAAVQKEATDAKPHRIGVFFWHDSPNDEVTFAGVKIGLEEAKVDATYLVRQAGSDLKLAEQQLQELQGADCELVLAMGTRATQLAQLHLASVPIVFAAVTNPVTAGIVKDWLDVSHDQGQTVRCGASNWIAPRSVLDVFRLAVPSMRRLGMLRSRDNGVVSQAELAGMRGYLKQVQAPAIELHEVVVYYASGLAKAVQQLQQIGVDAIWIPIDLTIYQNIPAIQQALGESRVPLLTTAATGVRNGALVGAAVDYRLHGRRAAMLVQRVLQAQAVPAAARIDRMHSSLVVVNLKAAHQNGIELPLSLLAIADELIAKEGQ